MCMTFSVFLLILVQWFPISLQYREVYTNIKNIYDTMQHTEEEKNRVKLHIANNEVTLFSIPFV